MIKRLIGAIVFILCVRADAFSSGEERGYLVVAELDRNSWATRTFYKKYVLLSIYENRQAGARNILWEEYDRDSGQLVSRVWSDGHEILLTDEARKVCYKWDIEKSGILLPQVFFLKERSFLNRFKILEMNVEPSYLPSAESRIKREDAIRRYDPGLLSATDSISKQELDGLKGTVLFLKDRVDKGIFKAAIMQNGLTFIQLIPSLKGVMEQELLMDLETDIKSKFKSVEMKVEEQFAAADTSLFDPGEIGNDYIDNEETSYYVIRKKLFERFFVRIKNSTEEFVFKNPLETSIEHFLAGLDRKNLRRVLLKPIEDTRYSKNISEINLHEIYGKPLADFLSIKWAHGNTSFRAKFYSYSASDNDLMKFIRGKTIAKPSFEGYEFDDNVAGEEITDDIFEEYGAISRLSASIDEVKEKYSDGSVDIDLAVKANLPDGTVLRVKMLKSGFDFVQGGDLSKDSFIRFSNIHVSTVKMAIQNKVGRAKFNLKPAKYEMSLEFSLDDQSSMEIRNLFKGIYLQELDRLQFVFPQTDEYASALKKEFFYMYDNMSSVYTYFDAILLSEDKDKFYQNLDEFNQFAPKFMSYLKQEEFLLNLSKDLSSMVLYFVSENLSRIKQVKKSEGILVVDTGRRGEGSEKEISIGSMRAQVDILYKKFQACLIRESFLKFIETFRGFMSVGLDRGMLKDIRSSILQTSSIILETDIYRSFLRDYFVIMEDDKVVDVLQQARRLFSNELVSNHGKLKELAMILKLLERKLMYGN